MYKYFPSVTLTYQTGQDAERAELLAELDRRQKQVARLHCDLEKAETEIVELRSIVRKMTAIQQIENTNEKRYAKVMLPGDLKQEQLSPHKIIGPEVKKTKDEDNAVDNTDTVFLEVNKIMTMQETRTVQNDVLHDGYISLNTEEKDNHRYSTLQNRYTSEPIRKVIDIMLENWFQWCQIIMLHDIASAFTIYHFQRNKSSETNRNRISGNRSLKIF
ncbi:uncharacterized protein [Ptychodera flava]|uniref:uncharacterized protein n=1 Tax=Ptychodera flava TaxID=63121 RepID=UPI00396A0E9B